MMSPKEQNQKPVSKSDSPVSNREGSSSGQKSGNQGMNGKTYHVPERMDTFPKTNIFPKNWDLSGFTKS
jgi:hypothetical protein